MKKYFSVELYKQGFKRLGVLGIGFTLAMAIINYIGSQTIGIHNGGGVIVEEIDLSGNSFPSAIRLISSLSPERFMMFSFVLVFLVPIISYKAFSFINDRKGADFYHALPQKRATVFTSFALSLVSWLGIMVLSGALASYVGWGMVRGVNVLFADVLRNILCYFILTLSVSAFTLFAMMHTGTVTSALLAANALVWIPPLVAWLFQLTVKYLYYPTVKGHTIFSFVGYDHFLPIRLTSTNYGFALDWGLFINLAVSVLFFVLAGRAYVNRKSETAASSVSGPLTKHLIRGAVPLFFAVVGFLGFFGGVNGAMFMGLSAVFFFLYEAVTSASLKAVLKSAPWFLTVVLTAGLVVGGAYLYAYCLEERVPDSADEVESITLTLATECDYLWSWYYEQGVALDGEEIKDKEAIDALLTDFHEIDWKGPLYYFDMKIKLNGGGTVWRKTKISKAWNELDEYLNANPSLFDKSYPLPKVVLLEGEDEELWDSFAEEYKTLSFEERKFTCKGLGDYEDKVTYRVKCYLTDENHSTSHSFYITPDTMPKTYKLLKEKGAR